MFLIRSFLTTPKHTIIYFHSISLQRDGHSWWNFVVIWGKGIRFGACQAARECGHLLFGFQWPGIMIRYAGCFGTMMDFFKQPRASVQIEATWSIWTFYRSFDRSGRFCLHLCLCIILTWNPIDYLCFPLLLVVHQRIYCFGIFSLWL